MRLHSRCCCPSPKSCSQMSLLFPTSLDCLITFTQWRPVSKLKLLNGWPNLQCFCHASDVHVDCSCVGGVKMEAGNGADWIINALDWITWCTIFRRKFQSKRTCHFTWKDQVQKHGFQMRIQIFNARNVEYLCFVTYEESVRCLFTQSYRLVQVHNPGVCDVACRTAAYRIFKYT